MQVALFGATGSLGSHLLRQCLERGLTVSALVRNPLKIQEKNHPLTRIVQGDVFRPQDVLRTIRGADAVLCALGDGAKGQVRASGTRNIIAAMEQCGVSRLVCQTTLGLGESRNNLNFFWKHIMFGLLLKKAFRDHELQEQHIMGSGLDYVIVRPSAFSDKPVKGELHVDFPPEQRDLHLKISRAELAHFMMEQLTATTFVGRSVSISH